MPDDFNAAGWVARCERCNKEEHTPAQHKPDAETALQATGRWFIGENGDVCSECVDEMQRESAQ